MKTLEDIINITDKISIIHCNIKYSYYPHSKLHTIEDGDSSRIIDGKTIDGLCKAADEYFICNSKILTDIIKLQIDDCEDELTAKEDELRDKEERLIRLNEKINENT